MSCKVGSTAIGEIYVGSQKIKEAYVGSTLVYQLSSPGPGPGPGPSTAWSPNPVTNLNIHAWQSPALTVSSCTADSSSLTISLDVSSLENSYWISGTLYWRVSVGGTTQALIGMTGSGNQWITPSPVTIRVKAGDTVSLGFYDADQQSNSYGIVGTLGIS